MSSTQIKQKGQARKAKSEPRPQKRSKKNPNATGDRSYTNIDVQAQKPAVSGTMQSYMQRTLPKSLHMTESEANAINAYLNPGHGDNMQNAMALPDGTPGRVFLFKQQYSVQVNTHATGAITFYNLPFFEAPFAYKRGTEASETLFTLPPPAVVAPAGNNPTNMSTFMKDHSVYAWKCLGKSMTIHNTTAPFDQAGSVVVGRKPSDVDTGTGGFDEAQLETAVYNQIHIQSLPITSAQCSASPGYGEWSASQGAYLVSHHEHHDWNVRKDARSKAKTWATGDANSRNGALIWNDMDGQPYYALAGLDSASSQHAPVTPGARGGEGTDVPYAHFSGLKANSTFTLKCVVIYQFQLKPTSDYLPFAIPALPFNPRLLEQVYAYEKMLGVCPMTADANFWSELWQGFKKFISRGGTDLIGGAISLLNPALGAGVTAAGRVAQRLVNG